MALIGGCRMQVLSGLPTEACFLCGEPLVNGRVSFYIGPTGGGNMPWVCRSVADCVERRAVADRTGGGR